MEIETEGKIARIRKDRKAVDLGFDSWYNSFKELSQDFKIGDYVKIVFNEKKVDDKIFKNIKSMVKIKEVPKLETDKLMIAYDFKESKNKNNETVKPKFISDTTINCLVMQSVDYAKFTLLDLDKATKEVINCYKEILKSL